MKPIDAQFGPDAEEAVSAALAEYHDLVATLRAGGHVDPDQLLETIRRALLQPEYFIRTYFSPGGSGLRPGGDCPLCGIAGAVRVRTSKRQPASGFVVRYLVCAKCGKGVGKQTVHRSAIMKRPGHSCKPQPRGRK